MSRKNKLQRFRENESFENLVQVAAKDILGNDHELKGQWSSSFFSKQQPITLELGCGKGEYTLALARRYHGQNFIGVDIKGARLWKGAKTALGEKLGNAAFLRTRIELIGSFFAPGEVEQIWLTFPDPQNKKRRNKKRLTSPRFLSSYQRILKQENTVHLKTDNDQLFAYTKALLGHNGIKALVCSHDVHKELAGDELLAIGTSYEKRFRAEGKSINYLRFTLPLGKTIKELPETDG
jgi:tRNA (guanine-N7-)-methyltransferase